MDDAPERLIEGLDLLSEVADAVTADDAAVEMDDATLQLFWREWPRVAGWAGALWRELERDLASAARPVTEGDQYDDLGGGD